VHATYSSAETLPSTIALEAARRGPLFGHVP
jgi:hypothetical protein